MSNDLLVLAQNLHLVDEMYARYQSDPASMDPAWLRLFSAGTLPEPPRAGANGHPRSDQGADAAVAERAVAVATLINSYRVLGHLEANLDPLALLERPAYPELQPGTYGIREADLGGELGDQIWRLRSTYCGTIGLEFMHILAPERRRWLQERMESRAEHQTLDRDAKIAILGGLVGAESFEHFVHTKYPGTKRFSIEGSETVIPLLDHVLEHAARLGCVEAVIGMAHRGRLSVLSHILGKKPREIFMEFEDVGSEQTLGGGDVKYHLGYSTDRVDRFGRHIHVSLAFNPSHLEAVDPIVAGRVRAKQRRHRDWEHRKVVGIMLHGDAAFSGQGLVAETLNMSELHGYRTGGSVHVIINNQIGFTASPQESRSTTYCTDVAKMLQCPIFHVNGEDPEAVADVVAMAMEYRQQFQTDVVIDMFCYRKFGHNEMDEPSFTQPLMYKRIQQKKSVVQLYAERLVERGTVTSEEVEGIRKRAHVELERELEIARAAERRTPIEALTGVWSSYTGGPEAAARDVDTGIPRERLEEITRRITSFPVDFHPHAKIVRLLKQREEMGLGQRPIDWGMGEALAFGSLLWEGTPVRLSGQDSSRGTFSQRHAVIVDVETGIELLPLSHVRPGQGACRVFDSPLSEAAVLGFEVGFALDYPDALVIWEAQFGDFVNGAQFIIDQFISSSEDKWRRLCGVCLFLPHGYEGQGPEHSSARFERFLQLAAEDNIQVTQPTTPAQLFHLLRRQVLRPWRKPLIVLTPKSLLRKPEATSSVEELTTGRFQRVLQDPAPPGAVTRIMLCSGKIYFDLVEERKQRGDQRTAILRIEQIYPWPADGLAKAFGAYANANELIWVQDEPRNMGAWRFAAPRLRRVFRQGPLRAATREESASPATGSLGAHQTEHKMLMDDAFGL